jgi:hypothetical protein
MALGTLSIEARGPAILRDLGCSLAFVSGLTGVEQSKLSLGFRQLKEFNAWESHVLSTTLLRLIEIRDAISPLAIDLRNPTNARLVLDAFKGLDAGEIRQKVSALF